MRASLVGLAALAGIVAYCYRMANDTQGKRAAVKEDLRRWEGEGGNVPSVDTPSPAPIPQASYPAGSEARH